LPLPLLSLPQPPRATARKGMSPKRLMVTSWGGLVGDLLQHARAKRTQRGRCYLSLR